MPIYAIAYGSHEDSDVVFFEHCDTYTQNELEGIAIKAIVLLLEKLKDGRLEQQNRSREWPFIHNISDLFPTCIKRAMEPFGFIVIEPEAEICFSGWQDPFSDETKWCGDDDETGLLMKALREAGFTEKDSSHYAYLQKRKKRKRENEQEEGCGGKEGKEGKEGG